MTHGAAQQEGSGFEATLSSIGDAIVVTDLQGRITCMNPAAESLTGWPRSDAVGQDVSAVCDLLDEHSRAPVPCPVAQAREEAAAVQIEIDTLLKTRDGAERLVEGHAAPVRDATGRTTGVVMMLRNISDRRQQERERADSEARYRTLFKSMGQGACVIDLIFDEQGQAVDYRFVEVNEAFESQSGLRDVIGKRMRELIPAHEGHWYELYGKVAMTGEPARFIHYAKALGGRWLDVSAFRIGRPERRRVAVIFTDITERRRLEQKVLEQNAAARLLASIVESSDDAIVSKTLDGIIQTWNQGAERLFGYTAQEAVGQHISLVIPPELIAEENQILARLRRGERVDHFDTVRQRRDGTRLNVSLTISPVKDDTGTIVGASKIARDVTERKAMERRIQTQARELAELNRHKDEFLAMLSHELRNPMAPIFNALQLIGETGGENELQRDARHVIERQVRHMSRLVDDLLEVSRITTGRIHLHPERVDINGIVERAIERVRPTIERRNQRLSVSLADKVVWLDADATRLEQVVGNLLNNASKYNEQGGELGVAVEPDDQQVIIRVTDGGIGIPPDLLPRIFDLFTQADQSLDRAEGGLGIGLALVKNLVEMHRGSVEARSDGVGRGSEFIVRLPVADVSQPEPEPEPEQPPSSRGASLRILVVDDNLDAAKMSAMLLRSWRHDVRVAHDGPAALQRVDSFRPQVVLMDIGLPDMDGYEVARLIRQKDGFDTVCLVAVTGYGQDSDRQRARQAGFDHHMVKPVEAADLKALLDTVASSETASTL